MNACAVFTIACCCICLQEKSTPGSEDNSGSVVVQLVGAEKHRPKKGEKVFLYSGEKVRDLRAHLYTDEDLRSLLHSKALLADDNIRYLEIETSDILSLDSIQLVSKRFRQLADPKGKTIITITFPKIIIKP